MAEVCKKCGLPKDLCVCETMAKEEAKIRVYLDRRRYGKKMTIVEGIEKESDPVKITKILKSKLACGGTLKEGRIELQGSHRKKVKELEQKFGDPEVYENQELYDHIMQEYSLLCSQNIEAIEETKLKKIRTKIGNDEGI